MGYLIATNIRNMVLEYIAAQLEAEEIRKRKEDKGLDSLLEAA